MGVWYYTYAVMTTSSLPFVCSNRVAMGFVTPEDEGFYGFGERSVCGAYVSAGVDQ